eukprot:EG_transcript_8053
MESIQPLTTVMTPSPSKPRGATSAASKVKETFAHRAPMPWAKSRDTPQPAGDQTEHNHSTQHAGAAKPQGVQDDTEDVLRTVQEAAEWANGRAKATAGCVSVDPTDVDLEFITRKLTAQRNALVAAGKWRHVAVLDESIATPEKLQRCARILCDPSYFFQAMLQCLDQAASQIHSDPDLTEEERQKAESAMMDYRDRLQNGRGTLSIYLKLTKTNVHDGATFASKARDLPLVGTHLCTAMDNAFPYGLVHAVIEMDGFHFEWGVQEPFGPSLIFPRFAVGPFLARVLVKRHLWSPELLKKALFCAGIGAAAGLATGGGVAAVVGLAAAGAAVPVGRRVMLLRELDSEKMFRVAEACTRFNRTQKYNVATCNCQHFVDSLLKALDIDFNPQGSLADFVSRWRKADFRLMSVVQRPAIELETMDEVEREARALNLKDDPWGGEVLLSYRSVLKNRLDCLTEAQRSVPQTIQRLMSSYADSEAFWRQFEADLAV